MPTKESRRQARGLVEELELRAHVGPPVRENEIVSAREFLRQHRHRQRFPHVEVSVVEHALPVVMPDYVNRMDAATLMGVLHEIDELYRVPVTLFYFQDHSYKEIAALLQVPIGTVMSRLARGKDQLRELLAKGLQAKAAASESDAPAVSEREYE